MKVRVLQQFLQSLIPPLSAGQAQPEIVGDLETISENLSGFSDKPIRELADFLTRAQEYEQQGNWPESSPPIVGGVVDQPSPKQMAQRLTAFLQREVHSTGPASIAVFDEMERLKKAMKAPELRQMAEACGVTGKVTTAARAIEASFEHLKPTSNCC